MDVLPLGLTGDGALRAAVAADREVTRLEGVRMDHLAEYLGEAARDWQPRPWSSPGDERAARLGGAGTPEIPEFAVCEVAAALGLSQTAATILCADVIDLARRLPRLAGAVRAGVLPFARARVVARRTRELTPAEAEQVEHRLCRTRSTGRGPVPIVALVPMSRLRSLVDQAAVAAQGPERSDQAAARTAASLYVDVVHEVGGATDLAARLATPDAARLDRRLDEVAGWLADAGDTRPRPVLRAVALGLLADPGLLAMLADPGTSADDAEPTHPPPDDQLPGDHGAAVRTVAGIGGLPADLLARFASLTSTVLYVHLDRSTDTWCEERGGVLTAAQARAIVGHSRVTVRPVLDLAEELTYTGYVAPPRLREQLALHNAGYCAFPSCHRRARAGDVDHRVPAARGGTTTSPNTHRLCRKHHRAKDKGRWRVVQPAPGLWLWTSPAGAVYLVTSGVTTPLNGVLKPPATASAPAEHRARARDGTARGPASSPAWDPWDDWDPLTEPEHDVSYGLVDTS